jgi:hypothetical protein
MNKSLIYSALIDSPGFCYYMPDQCAATVPDYAAAVLNSFSNCALQKGITRVEKLLSEL